MKNFTSLIALVLCFRALAGNATSESSPEPIKKTSISWECGIPQNPAAFNVTGTTASFSWEAPTGSDDVTMYQYCVVSNNVPVEGPVSMTLEGASYEPLTPGTTYQFFVRSFCSGVWGGWSAAVSFTTTCEALALPYSENFESVTTPSIPGCAAIENAGDGNDWTTVQNPGNGFSDTALQYSANGQNAAAWFITPGLQLETGHFYKISYKYGNNGAGIEKLQVSFANEQSASAMAANGPFGNLENITGGEAQTNSIGPFPAVTGTGVYYFGFNAVSDASQGNLYVDDITVEEWVCNLPLNISAEDVTDTTATINWEASVGNTAQVYQLLVDTNQEDPESGAFTPSLSNAVENLAPETTYYIHVRAMCSGVWSAWNSSVSFTTQALGVKEVSFASLKVYPNPARGTVTISNAKNIDRVEIFSLVGQRIMTSDFNSLQADLDISGLASGSYIMAVHSSGKSKSLRLIKE